MDETVPERIARYRRERDEARAQCAAMRAVVEAAKVARDFINGIGKGPGATRYDDLDFVRSLLESALDALEKP